MSPGSSSGAENSIAAGRKCGCGSVCWLCYSWNNNNNTNNNNNNNTNNNGGGPAYAANQLHSSSLHLQLLDQTAAPLAHHPVNESNGGGAATVLAAGDSSRGGRQESEPLAQQTKSSTGTAAVIRPLRSWSSSEKREPLLDEPPRSRGPRRFSAAGPPSLAAAGPGGTNNPSAGSTSSAKSAVGSQRSHVLASLHTWAEEEDELADGAMGAALAHSRASTGSSRLFQQAHGHTEYMRTQSTRYMHRQQHSSGSIGTSTTNGGSRFVVRHNVPELTFGFVEVGSSSGSSTGSGGPLPPSSALAAGAGNAAAAATAATAAARNTNHQRLRTPYSISIPSIIGSPLSFTQPFLATASRTSMFGRQPPSSQIRAAHIDWDSLSMAEELLGASACGGGNRNGSSNSAAAGCGGDLHLWQQGAAIDHLSFVGSANGGCGFGALQPAADKSAKNGAIHGVAGGQSGFPQRTIDPFVGPGAGLDHQSRLANYYYQQYLLQSQMHMLPPHLQSAVRQQQQLLQQQFLRQMQQAPHLQQHQQQTQQPQQQQQNHLQNQNQNQQQQQHNQQQKTNQQQQLQRQSQSQPLPQSQKQLQNQRPLLHHQQHPQLTHQHPQLTHQHQNELFPEFSPGHMAYPPAPGAVGTAVLAGIHSGGTGISAGGNPGGLIQQPHAAISEAYETAMAQLTLASALEKQMTWEYACQRHPVISGFAVAAPLRLSTAWRWGLLCLVLASTGCVLVGTPVALMVLLAHQDTIFLAANPF